MWRANCTSWPSTVVGKIPRTCLANSYAIHLISSSRKSWWMRGFLGSCHDCCCASLLSFLMRSRSCMQQVVLSSKVGYPVATDHAAIATSYSVQAKTETAKRPLPRCKDLQT